MALTNLEIHVLVEELQSLEGCFFEKMQDIEKGFKLKFTKHNLVVCAPEKIHLTKYTYKANTPSNISMYARKHLKGARVQAIKQAGFDRTIIIELDNDYKIIIEMFSKGNLVLVHEDKTKHCLRIEKWKDREIRPGREYRLPASKGLDPKELEENEFMTVFDQKDIIRSLVKNINMSGKYLEEVCFRAGVDKLEKEPSPEEKKKLFKELKKLIKERKPGIQEEPVTTKLKKSKKEYTEKESFNQALDDFHSPKKEVKTKTTGKLDKRLKDQEKTLSELKEKIVKDKQKGDLIYAKFNELNQLFAKIKEKDSDWKKIEEELGVKVNPKTKKFSIDL